MIFKNLTFLSLVVSLEEFSFLMEALKTLFVLDSMLHSLETCL